MLVVTTKQDFGFFYRGTRYAFENGVGDFPEEVAKYACSVARFEAKLKDREKPPTAPVTRNK